MKLTLTQWERYYPDIGNNRSLPPGERVWLEVERGLSTRVREGFTKQLTEVFATAEAEGFFHRLTAVLSEHLRFGSEPLRHEGGEVTTLEGYVELVFDLGNQRYTDDLLSLVRRANSFGKQDADFFERPSGTAPGTSDGLAPATV